MVLPHSSLNCRFSQYESRRVVVQTLFTAGQTGVRGQVGSEDWSRILQLREEQELIVLYCSVLYCIVLYCIVLLLLPVLYCTVLYCTVLYYTAAIAGRCFIALVLTLECTVYVTVNVV